MDRFLRTCLFVILGAIGGVTLGCSLDPNPIRSKVNVKLLIDPIALSSSGAHIPQALMATFPSTMDCLYVNVMGNGIFPNPAHPVDYSALENGSACATYQGITSSLIPSLSTAASEVSLMIPVGSRRIFQVIGVDSTIGCPQNPPVAEIIRNQVLTGGSSSVRDLFPKMFILGRSMIDLNADTVLDIRNDFDSSHPQELIDGCNSTTTLPLVAAASGYDSYSSIWGTVYNHAWPSTGSAALTPYSGSLAPFADFSNTTPYAIENLGAVSRADFLFDTSGIDISQFQTMRIRARAVGGTYTGSCNSGTISANVGVDAKPWVDYQNQWAPQPASTTANVPTEFSLTYGSAVVGVPSQFETASITGTPPSSTGPRYLVVSLRGTAGSGGYCSQLKVYSIEATVTK